MPLVLVFLPADENPRTDSLLDELNRRHKDFGAERSQVLVVLKATARQVREMADERDISVPVLADASGAMARDYDAADDGRAVAVIADRDGYVKRRFADLLDDTDPARAVESILHTIRTLGSDTLEDNDGDG